MELLNRIFYAASLDVDLVEPGMDLRELYCKTEEAKRSRKSFQYTLSRTGLSEEQTLPIWNVWSSSCLERERQGFLNGFRLGMMLSQELREAEKPEYS